VYFEYICWKFTGRLLDRVNTLLDPNEDVAQMFQFKRVMPWLHAPISSSEMLSDVTGSSKVYKPARPRKLSRVATLWQGITAVNLRMRVNFLTRINFLTHVNLLTH